MPPISHIDSAMTQFALAYRAPGFIADQIMPVCAVQKASDKYYKFDSRRDNLKAQDDRRGLNTRANRVDWANDTGDYSIKEHCLESVIDDKVRQNSDDVVANKLDQDATMIIVTKLQLNKEIALKAMLDSAITAHAAAAKVWTDSSAAPLAEIQSKILAVRESTGLKPNALWFDYAVYAALLNHPEIMDRIAYIKLGTQSNAAGSLAEILGLEKIVVGDVYKNASLSDTPSLSNVWGTTAYLGYVAPSVSLQTQTLGVTFVQNGTQWLIDQYRDESAKSDVKRGTWEYDQCVVDASLGYRITGCI